ncbi:hypothetical protein CN378_14035 [Bacillus sp. AFS015802]|uniref:hypothetical protein n=1 Tax=Bacillus sp. AFS015802 TaxID=2033486 RepID=UPI000BF48645|nr:hypothetical protein [Bacillus sp. AFS015802]PFA66411.1 hypothetical protein CN378_14035 [Bacillus sp. AFS015802]
MSEEKRQHPFDQMMYGGRERKKEDSPSREEYNMKADGPSLLDGVHSIMNSIDELKPLYKKISPFLKQLNSK